MSEDAMIETLVEMYRSSFTRQCDCGAKACEGPQVPDAGDWRVVASVMVSTMGALESMLECGDIETARAAIRAAKRYVQRETPLPAEILHLCPDELRETARDIQEIDLSDSDTLITHGVFDEIVSGS
jgi:hypothetical protein